MENIQSDLGDVSRSDQRTDSPSPVADPHRAAQRAGKDGRTLK